MRLNTDYNIIHRENVNYLVNIENGDVYEINDVCTSIFEFCNKYSSVNELADAIFSIYSFSQDKDCSKEYLIEFISHLIEEDFILI